MPATQASSPASSRTSRRLLMAPVLTILAAVAGLFVGRVAGQPGTDLLLVGLIVVIAACALAVRATTRPGRDSLVAVGFDAFRAELDRARRHRRTFAMARLELAAPVDGVAVDDGADSIAVATLRLIGASLRITDHAWLDGGDAVILLPESDRATAEAFVERLRGATPARFTARMGIAAFPDDGLTSGALLDALERGIEGTILPSPMVPTTVAGGAADLAAVSTSAEHVESGIG
jgi:hypothetical protein